MMLTLKDYLNKYAGYRFIIVGKGITPYNYENLTKITDPIIFLNDAVLLEDKVTKSIETFLVTAHKSMKVLLTSNRTSTLVLPQGPTKNPPAGIEHIHNRGRIFARDLNPTEHGTIVGYDWSGYKDKSLLKLSREEAAVSGSLYKAGSVCHLATHFAWICGASEIVYIGCDGNTPSKLGSPYDPRLSILSSGRGQGIFPELRNLQEEECKLLDIDYTYVQDADLPNIIPRIAHFVWLGSKPNWLQGIMDAFRAHNPRWKINLWTGRPPTFQEDLVPAWSSCEQLCQRADILYCWLLYHYGGVTLNTDLITRKSFDPLRKKGPAWTTLHEGSKKLTNGCMGAIRHSNAFMRCLARIPKITPETERRPRTRFGPSMLTGLFTENGDSDMRILPWSYFYPWSWREREKARAFWKAPEAARIEMLGKKDPYAVHLWGIDGSSGRKV